MNPRLRELGLEAARRTGIDFESYRKPELLERVNRLLAFVPYALSTVAAPAAVLLAGLLAIARVALALAAAGVLVSTFRDGRPAQQPVENDEGGPRQTGPGERQPGLPGEASREPVAGEGASGKDRAERTARSLRPGTLLLLAAIIPGAVLLADPAGMLTALGVMLLAGARVLGAPWRSALLIALALPAVFHAVFAVWLKVPLPRGPWGF